MIVTNTINIDGQRRIYLGGRSSLECWIEPRNDSDLWDFHLETSVTGNVLDADTQRACAINILLQLAQDLNVSPEKLSAVPFDKIAKLHTVNPYDGRRVPTSKHQTLGSGYFAMPADGYATSAKRRRGQARTSNQPTF